MNRITLGLFVSLLSLPACGGGSPSCPSGSRLEPDSGRCVTSDAGEDASADAAMADATMADAAMADAAMADASADAAMTDASTDASTADASMADASADAAVADGCVTTTYYADTDMDGFGDPTSTVDACEAPANFVLDATDCDDSRMAVNPGATEVCDGTRDDNCDGTVDEGCACSDGDTRACGMSAGECSQGTQSCAAGAWAACTGAVGPSAETCNGLDDDCDGATDEGITPPDICLSAGVCAGVAAVCRGAGFVCDYSGVPNYQPGDESRCDGVDNDCDGQTDEGLRVTYYRDADGDGFGWPATHVQSCPGVPPSGYVRNMGDCDDTCRTCFTGAPESCDGLDNNCNGVIDEGATLSYYRDLDGDGHGAGAPVQRCSGGSGWATLGDDCWDTSGFERANAAQVYPGQTGYFTSYRNNSTFDYNCSGIDEKRWTGSYNNCDASCTGEGWTSGTPACGVSGTYRRCAYAGSCGAPTETRTQECH